MQVLQAGLGQAGVAGQVQRGELLRMHQPRCVLGVQPGAGHREGGQLPQGHARQQAAEGG